MSKLKLPKPNPIIFSVFITGACVLIVEIVAVRVLSPHYGNTIFTFSSVITVILSALSIGYYFGGKLADLRPSPKWFYGIILISGIALLGFHFLSILALPILSFVLPLTSGPLISSLLLFLFPALLLGTLSPYAIKLETIHLKEQGIGNISGKIFFWSTLGSITGSLLSGFFLIPRFGINNIFIGTSVVLVILGSVPLLLTNFKKFRLIFLLSIFVLIFFATNYSTSETKTKAVYSKDGVYEKIEIYDDFQAGRPTRFFKQDKSSSAAMFLDSNDPKDLVYDYSKYYSIYKIIKPDIKNTLIIGGGAYSIPKTLLAESPDIYVDVAEIEPSLFELSKKYFNLKENPRLKNYIQDGRRLLKDSDKQYDLIFSDVYYSLFSVPAHFTTQEFFKLAKQKLSRDGFFIANFIGDLSDSSPSLTMSEIKTFKSVFQNSYFFAVRSTEETKSQNIIFVGIKNNQPIDFESNSITQNSNPFLRSLKNKEIEIGKLDLSPHLILTDNFSPVEYLTSQVLKRKIN
ncbi:MAG: fused MFS/spermidine synthase [Patescibacteria group bacterium]